MNQNQSPVATPASSNVHVSNPSVEKRVRTKLCLSQIEWEKLEDKQRAAGKEKLSHYMKKLMIDFAANNKKEAFALIEPGDRESRGFILPPAVQNFYTTMSRRFGIDVSTFVTRYVVVPAICGFNANVSMAVTYEADEEGYQFGSKLILAYQERGVTSYREIVKDLKLTHGDVISQEFLLKFRWIYTKYYTQSFGTPTFTAAPMFHAQSSTYAGTQYQSNT